MTDPELVTLISPLLTQAMYIEVFAGDDRIASGTGFIVERPDGRMLVSNRHVIAGREPETNDYLDERKRQPTRIRVCSLDGSAQPMSIDMRLFDGDRTEQWVEHPKYRHRLDLVGIPWPHRYFRTTTLDPLIVSGAPVLIGVPDPVLLLGFPLRFNGGIRGLPVAVSGMIATTPGLPVPDDSDLPRFLIDSATKEGLSGAPVLYYPNGETVVNVRGTTAVAALQKGDHQLLGIYTGRIREDAQLGYVITTDAIREMLADPQPGRLHPV